MQALGLIDRVPDPSDARAALLTLSEPGRVKVQAARAARREDAVERLGSWGVDTLTTFAALTQRLNVALSPDDTMAAKKLLGH